MLIASIGTSALLLLAGVRLTSQRSGTFTSGDQVTLFPSADGLWPMGSTGKFLIALKGANRKPLDHNQRVWGAWERLEGGRVEHDKVTFLSTNLENYGVLWARWHNKLFVQANEFDQAEVSLLGEDRSLLRSRVSITVDLLRRERNTLLWTKQESMGEAALLNSWEGGRILRYTKRGDSFGNQFLKVADAIRVKAGDDRFVVGGNLELALGVPRRWLLLEPQENGDWYALQIPSGRVLPLSQDPSMAGRLAWSEMPTFFRF